MHADCTDLVSLSCVSDSPRIPPAQGHHISISTVQMLKSQKALANDCMRPVTLQTVYNIQPCPVSAGAVDI